MSRPLLAAACLLLAACNSSKSSPAPPAPPASVDPEPAPAATVASTAVVHTEPVAADWDVPASWKPVRPGELGRDVVYRLDPAAGDTDPALFAVRTGGGVDSIVDRWKASAKATVPSSVKRTSRKVKSFEVTVVEIHGTTALLGAIVLSPGRAALENEPAGEAKQKRLAEDDEEGGGPLVLELAGPEKTVTAAKPDFDKLVDSLRPR